ncbi:MAG: hypothetical protein AAFQ09_01285 [Pseudomonadota bacterium]
MTKLMSAIAVALLLPMSAFAQGADTAPAGSDPATSLEMGGMAGAGPAIVAGVALLAIVAIAVSGDDDDDDSTGGTSGTD